MKSLGTALLAALFLSMTAATLWAKNYSCVVLEVSEDKVILECPKAEDLNEGMKIKLKTSSKKAIEGF